MTDMGNEFLVQYRASIEQRIREQIERHQRINPNLDPRRVVEIQMKQEQERLEKLIDDENTSPPMVELLEQLIDWLPQLEHKFKGL